MIKEQVVTVFADTGADISERDVKRLGKGAEASPPTITYANTSICVGYYVRAVMHGEQVANIWIYVVNRQVEPLLSGPAAEALGIITLNVADAGGNTWEDGKEHDQEANITRTSSNDDATEAT